MYCSIGPRSLCSLASSEVRKTVGAVQRQDACPRLPLGHLRPAAPRSRWANEVNAVIAIYRHSTFDVLIRCGTSSGPGECDMNVGLSESCHVRCCPGCGFRPSPDNPAPAHCSRRAGLLGDPVQCKHSTICSSDAKPDGSNALSTWNAPWKKKENTPELWKWEGPARGQTNTHIIGVICSP